MVAMGGWIMIGRSGNRRQLTHRGDGTPWSQDYTLQQCLVKQAHNQPFVRSAMERTTATHSVPYHTSTHYHSAIHLNSDRQVTDQAREWKSWNKGHAYSQGDVGSGTYAPSASYHIKPRTAPRPLIRGHRYG